MQEPIDVPRSGIYKTSQSLSHFMFKIITMNFCYFFIPILLIVHVQVQEAAEPQEPTTPTPLPVVEAEVSPSHWLSQANSRFGKDCKKFPSLKDAPFAKNVILFLGDGMGMPTISAGRFYNAELQGRSGAAPYHPFEEWKYNTMARTYDLETSVTDSASSATAYLTGKKGILFPENNPFSISRLQDTNRYDWYQWKTECLTVWKVGRVSLY